MVKRFTLTSSEAPYDPGKFIEWRDNFLRASAKVDEETALWIVAGQSLARTASEYLSTNISVNGEPLSYDLVEVSLMPFTSKSKKNRWDLEYLTLQPRAEGKVDYQIRYVDQGSTSTTDYLELRNIGGSGQARPLITLPKTEPLQTPEFYINIYGLRLLHERRLEDQ